VHPEHFHDKTFYPETKEENTIKATAEVIELLGYEVLFYLVEGKHSFVANLDSRTKAQVGDEIGIALDMEETNVFKGKMTSSPTQDEPEMCL
jgi:multiple sugar transport system ATP-binding protein